MQGQNAIISKIHNRSLVFRLIHQHTGISRKELSDLTGLTKASISGIIESMITSGLVAESARNRKEKNLDLVPEKAGVIAVYMGKVKISGAVLDLSGKIVSRDTLYDEVDHSDLSALPEKISGLVQSLLHSSDYDVREILAVGIAAPGAFEQYTAGEDLPDRERRERPFQWKQIGLVEQLRKETGLPVLIENRSSLAALAEQWFGAGKEFRTFVQYTVGMGIGGGVVVDNQLYRGANNVVCEIGHTTVDYRGEPCFCGNRGCLDTLGSMKNIINRYRELSGLPPYNLKSMSNGNIETELTEIFRRLEDFDPLAEQTIRDHAALLGIGAVTLVNIFNPECIIISANDIGPIDISFLVDEMELHVRQKAYPVSAGNVRILKSSLGEDIHIFGAFAMVMESFAQHSFQPIQFLRPGR